MRNTNRQAMVLEFMKSFGQKIPACQELPDAETIKLRVELILEEAQELGASDNLTDYLDAVVDILYVVYGAAVSAGFHPFEIENAFIEVHNSNMSKFWTNGEKLTHEKYVGDLTFTKSGDKWVARNKMGKVIKSPSYQPARLSQFINRKEP
jgi:hypothetical protein